MFIRKSKRLPRIVIAALMLTMLGWLLPGDVVVEKAEAATTLKNPRITVKATDDLTVRTRTWDCIYFGSYPQTEIVCSSDSGAIRNLEKMKSNGFEDLEYEKVSESTWDRIVDASYDRNGDAIVGNDKYRRITAEDAEYSWIMDKDDDEFYKDDYYNWQNLGEFHYFKYEPIKWRVLNVNGNDAFLMSDKCLDCNIYGGNTWEKSVMRSWLNGYDASENQNDDDCSSSNFIDAAFSKSEQSRIKTTKVVNHDDTEHGTPGGNDTEDKIYLLSTDEVCNTDASEKYGFIRDGMFDDNGRDIHLNTYAYAMGVSVISGWWLRSPGSEEDYAAVVENTGYISETYIYSGIYDSPDAVRPVLHLDISSSYHYSYAGEVSVKNEIEKITNVKLSRTQYVYDGKVKKPGVIVKNRLGEYISADNYSVKYTGGRKNVGTYKVIVTGEEECKGTVVCTFRILPKSTSISKLTSTKKGFTAKWKKQSTQTSGYQIMYATNSKFTLGKKTTTVSNNKTTSKKITKLKAKKKYYVKVRTYKKAGSTKYYSSWSNVKSEKTK